MKIVNQKILWISRNMLGLQLMPISQFCDSSLGVTNNKAWFLTAFKWHCDQTGFVERVGGGRNQTCFATFQKWESVELAVELAVKAKL